jgi:hypothetical protein
MPRVLTAVTDAPHPGSACRICGALASALVVRPVVLPAVALAVVRAAVRALALAGVRAAATAGAVAGVPAGPAALAEVRVAVLAAVPGVAGVAPAEVRVAVPAAVPPVLAAVAAGGPASGVRPLWTAGRHGPRNCGRHLLAPGDDSPPCPWPTVPHGQCHEDRRTGWPVRTRPDGDACFMTQPAEQPGCRGCVHQAGEPSTRRRPGAHPSKA